MPTVDIWNGYRFFFYSREGEPLEPIHIHVEKGGSTAKFWVENEVSLAKNNGFSNKELKKIEEHVIEIKSQIQLAWKKHFGKGT